MGASAGAFSSLVYVSLAAAEITALFKLALHGPALKSHAAELTTGACFAQPGMQSYPWLGAPLNQMLCSLNLIFDSGAHGGKAPAVLLNTFGPLFMTACAIATFESFRPVHRASGVSGALARAASLFVLFGQRMTAGFALPLQRAFAAWSGRRRSGVSDAEALRARVPDAKHIWAAYLALLGGMVLPTLHMQREGFSYAALSIWQPFPLYVLALNVVLPPMFAWSRNRAIPTVLLASLLIGASVRPHLELVNDVITGDVSLREAFLLDQPADTLSLAHGAHVLFAVDMAAVFALNALVVLCGYAAGLGGRVASALAFAMATVAFGPGGAFALFWGVKELSLQRALAKASPALGKLKTNKTSPRRALSP